jgi:CheY-like chemotaxis protein
VLAARSGPGRSSRPAPRPLRGITILLAEDDLDARGIIRAMLRALGAKMVVAKDGLDALRVLETTRPHIALVDLMMPRLDGFGLVERLRVDPRWRRLPVIAVTALGSQADFVRTWERNFSGHLTKPVDDVALASAVLRVLGRPGLSPPFDIRHARLADVFREAEAVLMATLETLSDGTPGREPALRVLSAAAALTRQVGQALLAKSTGEEGTTQVRHLVRGTLSVIMGWSRILAAKRGDDAAVQQASEVIDRNAKTLGRLLDPTGDQTVARPAR